MASPLFPRAHALALALLVGLGPTLKARADPHSLLASPHNLLETRLLRSAGGWTALLLLALAVAALPLCRPTAGAVGRAAARWAVGAALGRGAPCWLGDALDAATGRCWARGVIHGGTLLLPYSDPQSCRSHGHRWEGFGVSPQAFALVHCGLGLAEEVGALGVLLRSPSPIAPSLMGPPSPMAPPPPSVGPPWQEEPIEEPKRPGTALSLLFLLNVALILLWHFLLAVTLTYRHDWPRNAAGAAIGWASWAITYRCWYRYPWSPGPPGLGLPAP
ncbi:fat storage-inducing transmembrane protein 1-like [Strigops habroptila]|uniref:fat storage-inducing transmembrane protein 1-like n=1 Tax=Strigops habroptila TaxID=2489341 RepID=UPI0011CF06C4|nr:fat storage-inducing transmembrane protein 1-like [Strigops habroptila]